MVAIKPVHSLAVLETAFICEMVAGDICNAADFGGILRHGSEVTPVDETFTEFYSVVVDVAAAELRGDDGSDHMHSCFDSDGDNEELAIQSAFRDETRELIDSVAAQFADHWSTDSFRQVLETHPQGLLINIETGDVPELLCAGYPSSNTDVLDFGSLEVLSSRPALTLDELLTVLAGKTFDEMEYFEFADLTNRHIGFEDESEAAFDGARMLLASVGMIAAIRSLRSVADKSPMPCPVWVSVSEGSWIIGALTRVL